MLFGIGIAVAIVDPLGFDTILKEMFTSKCLSSVLNLKIT